MHTLPLNFTILKLCGLWRPLLCLAGWKFILYNCYTFFVIFLICTFVISEFVELFSSFDSAEEFAHGSFLLLTMIGISGKMAILLKKRQEIIELTIALKNDICGPRDANEIQIHADSERDARWMASRYTALVLSSVFIMMFQSITVDLPQGQLFAEGWLPYTYNSTQIIFFLTYSHQAMAASTGAVINIGFDTLFPGLIMLTCSQIRTLKYRFKALPQILTMRKKSLEQHDNDDCSATRNQALESQLIADCIRHHIQIFQLADTLNSIFGFVIFLQFTVSSLVICVSVYEVSKVEVLSSDFASTVLYLGSMLAQIFVFCFYGGELSLQSMEICQAVYKMDWSSFGIKTKQSLVMIMLRAQQPITFVCYHVITLTLDAFVSLVKLSYSAFNVISNDV